MDGARIVGIEWGCLSGERPRKAGSNARLGDHGLQVRVPIARITTDDGSSGFGACSATKESASALLGLRLDTVFSAHEGVAEGWRPFDYPLWDLAARRAGLPAYALATAGAGADSGETAAQGRQHHAPCYDTSLYFDDLHLTSQREAAALIAAEARDGYERGHRAFKIKVGRGARHLPSEEGTQRDIAVVRAVRQAVGPGVPLMLDANNGFTLNLAKRVLAETAECQVFWLEEAFHEDPVLYGDLRAWLDKQSLPVLIADGEGQASPTLLEWARQGLIDVIQYDILAHGFTRWLTTGRELDSWGVRSAPHHYGVHYGNYVACHLAGAIRNFSYVEWDEATTPGLDTSGYSLHEGWISVPASPGFGLLLDDELFRRTVEQEGFRLTLPAQRWNG